MAAPAVKRRRIEANTVGHRRGRGLGGVRTGVGQSKAGTSNTVPGLPDDEQAAESPGVVRGSRPPARSRRPSGGESADAVGTSDRKGPRANLMIHTALVVQQP